MTTKEIKYACERVSLANELIEQCEFLRSADDLPECDMLAISEIFKDELHIKHELLPKIDTLICKNLCTCEWVYRPNYMFLRYIPIETPCQNVL